MHSLPSNQLVSLKTFALIAGTPNGVTLLRSTPCSGSKILPCHATACAALATISDTSVPGSTITVPSASPRGISPDGLFRNRSSSCCWFIPRRALPDCGSALTVSSRRQAGGDGGDGGQ